MPIESVPHPLQISKGFITHIWLCKVIMVILLYIAFIGETTCGQVQLWVLLGYIER